MPSPAKLLALAVCGSTCVVLSPVAKAQESSGTPFAKFENLDCSAMGSCTISFGTVPAGRQFLIKSVSCYVVIGNVNGRVLYWYLQANKNGQVIGRIHIRPNLLGTTSTSITYNGTETAYLRLPPGTSISVGMTRDGSTAGAIPGMDCTLTGDNIRIE